MNKLLALSVALLSVSLYGAEKSLTGLEGIAKDGLGILVEDYSDEDKTFDKKGMGKQVELRLLQSGIEHRLTPSYLYLDVFPILTNGRASTYVLTLEANRAVTFEANGKTYKKTAIVWNVGGEVGRDKLRNAINKQLDDFLLAYHKANPKKKEKE